MATERGIERGRLEEDVRIAYVYDAVHPWETGGVQTRVWELSRRLADGHDVHWYGFKYWDGASVLERDGVTLHGVTPPRGLYVGGRRSITEAIRFALHLVRPLLSDGFNVVDCQAFPYFPGFPSKLGSVRHRSTLVMTWHEVWGDYWYEYLGGKGLVGKWVERLISTLPDEHLVVSATTRRELARLGVHHSRRIPNGISFDEVSEAQTSSDTVDVLFVGRLIPEKNPDLLVRAIHELQSDRSDVSCRIVGEGPQADEIDRLIETLGLEVSIERTGFFDSHEALLGLMKASKVFALPSRREGFGITALEALACGTPVVTIDHPQNAVSELIDDGSTGFICEATPTAIADGIVRAMTEVSGSDCKDAARPYEWDRIANRIESFYREVV